MACSLAQQSFVGREAKALSLDRDSRHTLVQNPTGDAKAKDKNRVFTKIYMRIKIRRFISG